MKKEKTELDMCTPPMLPPKYCVHHAQGFFIFQCWDAAPPLTFRVLRARLLAYVPSPVSERRCHMWISGGIMNTTMRLFAKEHVYKNWTCLVGHYQVNGRLLWLCQIGVEVYFTEVAIVLHIPMVMFLLGSWTYIRAPTKNRTRAPHRTIVF